MVRRVVVAAAGVYFVAGEQIAEYPFSGRMIPEFQVEQLREVIEQGFRIMYEVLPDRIEVFGVVHARRDVFGEE